MPLPPPTKEKKKRNVCPRNNNQCNTYYLLSFGGKKRDLGAERGGDKKYCNDNDINTYRNVILTCYIYATERNCEKRYRRPGGPLRTIHLARRDSYLAVVGQVHDNNIYTWSYVMIVSKQTIYVAYKRKQTGTVVAVAKYD